MFHLLAWRGRKGGKMGFWLAVLLVFNLTIIGVWDLVALYSDRHDITVSAILHDWSQAAPTLLLWIGLVLGHCFLPLVIQDQAVPGPP